MNSPQELIERAKNSPAAAYHKFVLLSKNNESDLFCFFEGQDSKYYSSRIKTITNRECHPIICGNKISVLKTYEIFQKQHVYNKYKKLYFVDSDFDPPINIQAIYETPCYSIENFYCQENTLKEILKNEFLISQNEQEFSLICEIFNENQKNFHSATALFNAWYALQKDHRNKTGIPMMINLDEKLPKEFICLEIGKIKSNYDLNVIKKRFPDAVQIDEQLLNKKTEEFLACDGATTFRGKYEICFFYEFLQYLINDANKEKKIIKKKTSFSIGKGQMLSQISQYASTPNCLVQYLIQYKILKIAS